MRAVQYTFEDEDWLSKVAVGCLVSIVPILNLAAMGYMVETIRNVAHDEPRPLPKWDRLGDLFIRGLYVLLAQIAYSFVPSILLSIMVFPLFILPLLGGENEDAIAALSGIALVGMICIGLVGLVLMIVASFVLIAGILRFSVGRQELSELFEVKTNFEFVRDHIGPVLLAILSIFGSALVIMIPLGCIGGVLGLIPVCGQILAFVIGLAGGFLIVLFAAHIYGQVAREAGLVSTAPPAV